MREKGKMLFFITAIKICLTRIRPLKGAKRFFLWILDSLKFVIKKLGEQLIPLGGGGGVLPDGIYNVTFYRGWFSSMQLRLGLGIEIREQLFYREGFGEFSLIECSKIQLNQEYRLGFRGSQQRLPPKKFSQDPPPLPPTPLGGKS